MLVNDIILIMKYYICKQKLKKETPNVKHALNTLKDHYKVEQEIISNKNMPVILKFNDKWKPLTALLQNKIF